MTTQLQPILRLVGVLAAVPADRATAPLRHAARDHAVAPEPTARAEVLPAQVAGGVGGEEPGSSRDKICYKTPNFGRKSTQLGGLALKMAGKVAD